MGNEMAKNLKLLLVFVMACQVGMVVPASSQSNFGTHAIQPFTDLLAAPIGTANTIGSVSN